ncbi:spore germination protein, partial [Bacillus sp. WP8]|uniref:spore germination protein n=1 Tax=Bacillus sp. WP8 TaxID=756828 RepID=UPI0011A21537
PNQENVEHLNRRISSIKLHTLLTPPSILQPIHHHSFSIFPHLIHTQPPHKLTSPILQPTILLLIHPTPIPIILPITFFTFFHSPHHYNTPSIPPTFIPIFPYLPSIIPLIFPSFYIPLIPFHYHLLPHQLPITINNSIIPIPFPPLIQPIFIHITIQLIP